MDELLIEELISKTTVPYEILIWHNNDDLQLAEFIKNKQDQGLPLKLVGATPENIGMAAFKPLFEAASYDMIVQLDDDVTVITPKAAEICADIFSRRPEVKQIVSDVWQDEYTSGAHPGMAAYKPYALDDGLYDGPIDGGFSVYHRSILPIVLQAPFEKYFYLGAWVRGAMPSRGYIGVLCKKIKIFHVYGAIYASAYGLFDFEHAKFKAVGLIGIASGFDKWREKLPSKDILANKIDGIKKALSVVPETSSAPNARPKGQGFRAVRSIKMAIDVYTMVHNEEIMMPYFLRHYGRFASKITVFDNESNDRTAEIARSAGAEVIPIDTGGKHRVDTLQRVMNEEYKRSRGHADWVICAEGDEFLWHPDLPGLLEQYAKEGITFPKTSGFDMVADAPPNGSGQIWDEIKNGIPNKMYSKRAVFHPMVDVNFGPGGHHACPKGLVVESQEAEILLLHYRFLGEKYFANRYEIRRQRMSEEDLRRGLGARCMDDHQERYRKHLADAGPMIRTVIPQTQ